MRVETFSRRAKRLLLEALLKAQERGADSIHLDDLVAGLIAEGQARRRTYLHEKFDFLGYTFRARSSMTRKGKHFVNFSPAISAKAEQAIRTEVRSWRLPQRSDKAIEDLSRIFNPIVRGWLHTTGGIIARRSIRRCANWIAI
jgi:RNA-directed DNA polymerase